MLNTAATQPPLTVTELAQEIKRELRPLWRVFVKGEVSGMKQLTSGHYSFRINDAESRLDAFLFANDARRLALIPEDGQEFVFRGRVDFAPKYGQLRLIVDYVEYDDVGRLRAQLEQLKQKLEAEGAFESARKRPLPFLPRCVALITSPTGAVIHDLQETIWDRFPNLEILVYPAQVQGTASPGSVAAALRRCNDEGRAAVAVIARGGGSFEELYAFNTEPVARAILASRMPVVTALGHTSDRTIADLVADAECRTPTEAGARVVPRKADLLARLDERRRRVDREATGLLRVRVERLRRSRAELARLSPAQQLARRHELIVERATRLEALAARTIRQRQDVLAGRQVAERLQRAVRLRFAQARAGLEQRGRRLEALSPDSVLLRGYSITQDEESGTVLRAASETAPGRRVRVRLGAGALTAAVATIDE
ncbi:MAG TPA: exodeoxyribonuclease VII large subunit [Candidatus Dormibacteraeota bacterium]